MRAKLVSIAIVLVATAGCSERRDPLEDVLGTEPAFLAVYRDDDGALDRSHALKDPPPGMVDAQKTFYLAIHRRALAERWFLSAYSKQFVPGGVVSSLAARSLGVRIVSLRIGNGQLHLFDADDRRKASDVFVPEILIESYPIVSGYTAFEQLDGASKYVLIDPAAGLNRYGVETDSGFFGTTSRFEVELSFSQRFRAIEDGATFEKVFTGYASIALPNSSGVEPTSVRGSGVLSIALRRYAEGEGFAPVGAPQDEHFFTTLPRQLTNQGTTERRAIKWNLKRGMRPVKWLIGDISTLQKESRFSDYDLFGAIKQGIESWNNALGFPIFTAEAAQPGDSFADDDKNFFIVNIDPRRFLAFANFRPNPTTGEIRGASIYFSSGWIDFAHTLFTTGDVEPPMEPTPSPTGLRLVWDPMPGETLCQLDGRDGIPSLEAPDVATAAAIDKLPKKERVERFIAHIAAHEVGHTLGLRHNFKGSLRAPSTSVMDYLDYVESAVAPLPGAYDVSAVRFLYGLTDALPAEPFCTDQQVARDPLCERRDATADPLKLFHARRYQLAVDEYLAKGDQMSQERAVIGLSQLLRFVRVGTAEQRLEAWRLAITGIKAPVPPGKLSGNAMYGARVDTIARQLFTQLFPVPTTTTTGTITFATSAGPAIPDDAALRAEVAAEMRLNLINADRIRLFPTRRLAVDVLKKLQSTAAYRALLDSRAVINAERVQAQGDDQLLLDDLHRRVEVALSPYFQ
jgi:hypothetical protein